MSPPRSTRRVRRVDVSANPTLLANPWNRTRFLQAASEDARKNGMRGDALRAHLHRQREVYEKKLAESFQDIWQKKFTQAEQAQLKHTVEQRINFISKEVPRFATTINQLLSHLFSGNLSSAELAKRAVDFRNQTKKKGTPVSLGTMEYGIIATPLESAIAEAALTGFYIRIFREQGVNVSPLQAALAVQERFGSVGVKKWIEAKPTISTIPSPEDVNAIYHRIRTQRKEAKRSVWEKHLVAANLRKKVFGEYAAQIKRALNGVFLSPNTRRKIIGKTVRELMKGNSAAITDIRQAAIRDSVQLAKRRLEGAGYKPAEAKELLERIGINGARVDEGALNELHLEITTAPLSNRREAIKTVLARLSKEHQPELELEKLTSDIENAERVTIQQMTKLDHLLRTAMLKHASPKIVALAAQQILLWRIITHGSGWPLLSQIKTESRLDRTGINLQDVLVAMNKNGLLGRHHERWFVNNPTLKQKYSNAKPDQR
jgi:hypothetical protein